MIPDLLFPRPVPPRPPCARQHCRHYSYHIGRPGDSARGPQCALGRDMSGTGAALPCMPPDAQRGATCPQREDWSVEERTAWAEWSEESVARVVLVLATIPTTGNSGILSCPACGTGNVHWYRASRNGHLNAACSTPSCFSIIQ